MRLLRNCRVGLVWGFFLLAACPGMLRAAERSEANEILDKAIQARGGAEQLAKYHARVAKGTGTIHKDGLRIHMTYECLFQGFDKARSNITFEAAGTRVKSVTVIDHDRGWAKKNDEPARPLTQAELAVEREALYLEKVVALVPLKDPSFTVTTLAPTKVHGHDAVGLQVRCAGHPDVHLYFDKETWLLVKADEEIRKPDEDINLEVFPGNYQHVRDVKVPMRIALRYGEAPYAEYHHSELRLLENLDEHLFDIP